ncbi:MAG TPA: flagellar biosynthesis protein FlhA [Leptospiraceae bacterium]|nr:flagellar biosynthesis protein FlhA [Leptospirales bacterium]HMX57201.1 flagellar biosynthesis protein FlhA [Leptospiraceae bacterium]HMZ35135.1 flagellar biosynthesis protein FlhA [Leptospiraceae bacterium]HNE23397.1 flagellar biosynthesis protein FlhA [Leptospiraceae bacterium]HNJ33262.1 flagellar biosynthesis protein FlhA [Leptospiraceae bacterium]
MLEEIRKNLRNADTVLGIGVILIFALIVVPLPGPLLDALIAVSLLAGLLILLTALSSKGPADFTVFPTILLVTTIYRLAVNVSTTRMILSKGEASNSALVNAFGTFVVGGSGMGSYVIGAVIFIIVMLVQIMVITKGATRVSEVAARFALDAMTGKQMAIDTDLQNGHITEQEARQRRENVQKESNFYGAMDGASKFIQGDVRVGLIITGINIVGGLIIGMTIRGEPFIDALARYTKFTIGDGLVNQIPALMISAATGVIVTRSVGEESLPTDIRKQLFRNPQILYVVGAVLVMAGLLPGFPLLSMGTVGGFILFLGYRMDQSLKQAKIEDVRKEKEKVEERKPESYTQQAKTDKLGVEIGYNLIPLVDPKSGGTLLDQISRLRGQFARDMGLIVPPVRIRDNMSLQPNQYHVRLDGDVVGDFVLKPDHLIGLPTRVRDPLPGLEEFTEPTYNMRAVWVPSDMKTDAENAGYDVVDPASVIATHLSSIIRKSSADIMGRQEIKEILDSIRQDHPVIVSEVLDERKIPMGRIQEILKLLLREGVSIRNMVRILEVIAGQAEKQIYDPYIVSEAVRMALRRQIVADYIQDGVLHCITVSPDIERRMRDAIHSDPTEGFILALKPDLNIAIRDAFVQEFQASQQKGKMPVFMSSRVIRSPLFDYLIRFLPAGNFTVLAHEEVPQGAGIKVEVSGQVALQKAEVAV